jgi:hypothetical protein
VQQDPDFIQRHVQTATTPNKGQSLDMGFPIDAVVAFAAGRYWQQPITLVIADRFHIRPGKAGQFADFHLRLLTIKRTGPVGA